MDGIVSPVSSCTHRDDPSRYQDRAGAVGSSPREGHGHVGELSGPSRLPADDVRGHHVLLRPRPVNQGLAEGTVWIDVQDGRDRDRKLGVDDERGAAQEQEREGRDTLHGDDGGGDAGGDDCASGKPVRSWEVIYVYVNVSVLGQTVDRSGSVIKDAPLQTPRCITSDPSIPFAHTCAAAFQDRLGLGIPPAVQGRRRPSSPVS